MLLRRNVSKVSAALTLLVLVFAGSAMAQEAITPFTAVSGIAATIAAGVGLLVAAGVTVLAASMGGAAAYRYAKRFLGGR